MAASSKTVRNPASPPGSPSSPGSRALPRPPRRSSPGGTTPRTPRGPRVPSPVAEGAIGPGCRAAAGAPDDERRGAREHSARATAKSQARSRCGSSSTDSLAAAMTKVSCTASAAAGVVAEQGPAVHEEGICVPVVGRGESVRVACHDGRPDSLSVAHADTVAVLMCHSRALRKGLHCRYSDTCRSNAAGPEPAVTRGGMRPGSR